MTAQSSIEMDFSKSWDDIEKFYVNLLSFAGWNYVEPVQDLVKHLRTLGYDKLFRAGQSIHVLVLSRSRHWGLRNEQHRLSIEATAKPTFRIKYVGDTVSKEFEIQDLIVNKELFEALNHLLQQKID